MFDLHAETFAAENSHAENFLAFTQGKSVYIMQIIISLLHSCIISELSLKGQSV